MEMEINFHIEITLYTPHHACGLMNSLEIKRNIVPHLFIVVSHENCSQRI